MADRLLLGMDIGGSKAVTVLGRGAGDIVAEDRIDGWACGSWERDLETLVAHTRQLCATAGVELAQVAALGISAPGPLDPAQGVVTEAPNLPGWVQVPLVARLSRRSAYRVCSRTTPTPRRSPSGASVRAAAGAR